MRCFQMMFADLVGQKHIGWTLLPSMLRVLHTWMLSICGGLRVEGVDFGSQNCPESVLPWGNCFGSFDALELPWMQKSLHDALKISEALTSNNHKCVLSSRDKPMDELLS